MSSRLIPVHQPNNQIMICKKNIKPKGVKEKIFKTKQDKFTPLTEQIELWMVLRIKLLIKWS